MEEGDVGKCIYSPRRLAQRKVAKHARIRLLLPESAQCIDHLVISMLKFVEVIFSDVNEGFKTLQSHKKKTLNTKLPHRLEFFLWSMD